MKIIILNHYERLSPRIALETETLERVGHHMIVVKWCRNAGNFSVLDEKENGLPVRWIALNSPKGSLRIIFALPGLYKEMWKLLKEERFDVIHCTHLFLLPIAIFAGKKKKVKVVYDAYERYATDITDHYFPFLKSTVSRLIEMIENFLVKRVSGILTISSANEVLEKRYKNFCKNVEVLYNVPISLSSVNGPEIEKLKSLYKERYIMTYVGSLVRGRGLFKLIEVLDLIRKEFPNILLLLIGEFSSLEDKEQFLRCIREKGLGSYVDIVPWLPYNEMFQYLKMSRVALAPHRREERFKVVGKGSGRKFFTYMHAGIPVVATNFGEIAKVIEEERCGILVDTMSTQAIANAVIFLLKNENVARKMGENGRKAVLGKYNWEKEEKKLLNLYERILVE